MPASTPETTRVTRFDDFIRPDKDSRDYRSGRRDLCYDEQESPASTLYRRRWVLSASAPVVEGSLHLVVQQTVTAYKSIPVGLFVLILTA